ncbi:MAG TPA: tripartite tricarboxylate transporter substrate binding protein, partial [Xanthobacteraceae bacterium]|nr:tripartite tricarboxylate transporter substrate binding protein [Xanthobacteraceae bacterium]
MRVAFALLLVMVSGAVGAQDAYPTRQITLIAPYAAGGSTDLVARVLSEGLRARFNQPVTVSNLPGGNGVIGTREVVKAPPDGYTLLIGALGAQVLPAVMAPNFPFDPLRDFIPVAGVAEWAGVMLVKKELPVNSLHEFIAYARTRPGQLNFGSSGYGSTVHLIAEILMRQTGIKMQHVPYKGGSNSMTDLMSGSLDVLFTSSPVAVGQAENRGVKILAVASKHRLKLLPDVPTMEEAGVPGVTQTQWLGVFGPPGLPEAIRRKLSAALVDIIADADTQTKLRNIGFEPVGTDYVTFDAFFRAEVKRWAEFVRD